VRGPDVPCEHYVLNMVVVLDLTHMTRRVVMCVQPTQMPPPPPMDKKDTTKDDKDYKKKKKHRKTDSASGSHACLEQNPWKDKKDDKKDK
jgi:hypothetical protein